MEFDLAISAGSATPIFKQIVDQVRLAVVTGRVMAGDQLPSVRGLAERLLVNPNTIARAYGELAREGIIDSQKGRGFFIARSRQIYTRAERLRRVAPLIGALVNEGLALGFSPVEISELVEQQLAMLDLPKSLKGKAP